MVGEEIKDCWSVLTCRLTVSIMKLWWQMLLNKFFLSISDCNVLGDLKLQVFFLISSELRMILIYLLVILLYPFFLSTQNLALSLKIKIQKEFAEKRWEMMIAQYIKNKV